MTVEMLRFALLGLATGAIYGLLSQGMVLIYRGSGLLNFAQGAMAMFGAYAYYDMTVKHGIPQFAALVLALVLCGVLGAAIHLLILRSMRTASPLSRVIATLGVVLVLQSAAVLRYGDSPLQVPALLPAGTVHLFGDDQLPIGRDRVYIFVICLVLSAALYAVYKWTAFGRMTTAVAENQLAAASFGYSPDRIAAMNWAIGSMLAGLAGILIAPIIFLEPFSLVLLVVPAMAAALVGQFSSFPLTLVSALALGVAQSEIGRYVTQPGWATAAPFLAVIAILAIRGRGLPLRSFVLDRLPAVGSGRVRPLVVLVAWAVGSWIALQSSSDWAAALVATFGTAVICLSVVLITGYAGQLSLAQFVIAGVGAFVAAKLSRHMGFLPALLIATLATVLVGGILGLPALRARGATLAVATLGLGAAVVAVIFVNPKYTGGLAGIPVASPSLLGWSLDPFAHPQRYAFVAFTAMVLIALLIANLRRGVTGRRLLAVRSNERAAASLGVSVAWVKTFAFMVSAGIAAVGGILLALFQPTVQVSSFDVVTCILIAAVTVAGGVGYVPGALLGSLLVSGGVLSKSVSHWPKINEYFPLAGGVILILVLMIGPDGLVELGARVLAQIWKRVVPAPVRKTVARRPHRDATTREVVAVSRVEPQPLVVEGISVRFGGVHAVRDVSLRVNPGEVHGLIGPNGAGKTTFIDAVTGFVATSSGTVRVGAADISRWSPRRRFLRGLSRSFQSLELFDDLTISENLALASERESLWRYLTDMVWPGRIRLSVAAVNALHSFELDDLIDVRPTAVSFGRRKTVAIARSIAASPSILLLDEPAAGLDDHEADELAALIRTLAEQWGIGILLVEHKVDLIMSTCDRITVLEAGSVIASGRPDDIRSHPAVVAAYLGARTAVSGS